MDLIGQLAHGFDVVSAWQPLLAIVCGVATGIIVGAMPGLSPSMGVALLVPFTYAMEPTLGVILLTAIYLASNYGGSITAVMINAPGTPASAVTAFDGYPLTQQGRPGVGLAALGVPGPGAGLQRNHIQLPCIAQGALRSGLSFLLQW